MDPSDHSSNFNSAQMATDQREGSDALSGQTVPSSAASYQTNSPPHYNPCSLDNWSRYISQPLYMTSGLPSHFYPQILGTESYNMDMSHHPLDTGPHSYLDHHDIPSHIHAVMDSPDLGPMGEVKPEYVHEDHSDWRTFRPALKEELYYHTPGVLHSVPHAPPSPPSTASSYASPDSGPAPSPARTTQGLISRNPKEERTGNQPYSVLIYRALKGADGNKLSLQGIYRWFEEHTDKAKDPNHKGWQNSIRHNLSMNAGFEAVKEDVRPGEKPANFWRLTSEAIKDGGIQSTTRYRKGSAKGAGRGSQREPTQSKGGQPPKKIKTGIADNQANSRVEILGQDYATTELPPMSYMPQVFASGHPSVNHFVPRFSMGPVSGCTAQFPGNNGVFIDGPEMGPDYGPTYAIGHGWYAPSPVPNDRAVAGSNVPAGPMLDCKDQ